MSRNILTSVVIAGCLMVLCVVGCKEESMKRVSDMAVEKRVDSIVSQMTLDEKVRYLGGTGFVGGEKIGETVGMQDLGVPVFKMTDATLGSKLTKGATLFPAYVCQAAAFDPELAYEYGKAVAEQCKADGFRIVLGPGVNIYRIPNCGRNFEYCGEDPYLASRTTVEYIRGVQDNGVIATVKHFAANNTDFHRKFSNSIVDERTLREIYFPAFKAAVQEADARALMTSYNLVNGHWAAENMWLVTDVLREEWGFDGMVMTDWWSVYDTELLLSSGLDIEMPEPEVLKAERVMPLIESGKVSESYIDERVKNILRPCVEFGLLNIDQKDVSMRDNWPKHAEVAKRIAGEGLVLLKNDNILPLDRGSVKRIALVGENATKTVSTGGGAAGFDPGEDFITYADAIRQAAGGDVDVYVAKPEEAQGADVALVFATLSEHENVDHPFAFEPEMAKMINDTAAVNSNTVVVVSVGTGVEMQSWIGGVKGVVYAWYPGTYGAVALGDMLFGELNPSGKLPFTIEKRPEDSHYFGNSFPDDAELYYEFPGWDKGDKGPIYDVNYREGVLVGYRWYDTKNIEPMFEFGFGLSYTAFDFDGLKLSAKTLKGDDKLVVSFEIENEGDVDGAEVAQMYIRDVQSSVVRPFKELKGFKKVYLKAGQEKTVKLTVDKSALSFWCEKTKQWTVEPGEFEVLVGSSSRDIKLRGSFVYEN